ncbi:hypothetical protein BDY24DRAFT_413138 [Mrakia frigida]|uniref:Con-6 family protein n=1 Tax=Mrakia frigida TaxID=29902 RepID=UPI003FCC2363
MFSKRSHHTTATSQSRHNGGFFSRGPSRAGRAGGLKAAINNPNVTSAGRKDAKHQLHAMGLRAPKERFSTRLRRFFGLGGRRKNRPARP